MDREYAITIAANLLKISDEEAAEYCCQFDGLDAWYFSVPLKGGGSLIVGDSDEVLYADSTVNPDDHIEAFKRGIRTPLEAFEN